MGAKGANARICIQEETVYKTDPTPAAAQKLHIVSCGFGDQGGLEGDETLQANRNPSEPSQGDCDPRGPLVINLQAYMGRLWKLLFGSATPSGETAPYTHTFKIGTSVPSFLLEKGFTDLTTPQYFKSNGVKIARMSMNITRKGPQPITFDLVGAKETIGTGAFQASPTDLGYTKFEGLSLGTVEEGGSTSAEIVEITGFTIDNGLDEDQFVLGGVGQRAALDAGRVSVSGTIKALFNNVTLLNKAINGTESSLRLGWARGTGVGTAGNESFELKIPELKYGKTAVQITGPKGIYVELPFQAFCANSSEETAIQAILKSPTAVL